MTENELPVNAKRDFKGIWIPKEIWRAEGLSPTEKILWAEIDSLYHPDKNGCFATNEYLAKFMGVKERTVRDALFKLRQLKLIEDISFDGRERVIKALPVDAEFSARLAAWRKTATLNGENPEVSMAENRHPHVYIDTTIVTTIDTPPIPPQIPKSKKVAIAPKEGDSSSSKVEVSEKAVEVANSMIEVLKANSPVYRPPKAMKSFLEAVGALVDYEQQDPKIILQVLEWATNDRVERNGFPGWSSVIYGKNGITSFRKNFGMIHGNMISQPKRRFAASSDDRAAAAEWEAKKGEVL